MMLAPKTAPNATSHNRISHLTSPHLTVNQHLLLRRCPNMRWLFLHVHSIILLSVSFAFAPPRSRTTKPLPSRSLLRLQSPPFFVHNEDKTNNEESTVATLTTPDGKTKITLIGTAHLSKRSNEQVTRLIQEVQPNVVMVEVDPTRLSRIGIESMEKIQVERVVSSDDIVLPTTSSDQPNRWNPFQILQDAVLEAFTRISRALLTGMYEDMSKEMTNGADKNASGGEFLAAIRAEIQASSPSDSRFAQWQQPWPQRQPRQIWFPGHTRPDSG